MPSAAWGPVSLCSFFFEELCVGVRGARVGRCHRPVSPGQIDAQEPQVPFLILFSDLEHPGGLPGRSGRLRRLFSKYRSVSCISHARQLNFLIVMVLAHLGNFYCQTLGQMASKKRENLEDGEQFLI